MAHNLNDFHKQKTERKTSDSKISLNFKSTGIILDSGFLKGKRGDTEWRWAFQAEVLLAFANALSERRQPDETEKLKGSWWSQSSGNGVEGAEQGEEGRPSEVEK